MRRATTWAAAALCGMTLAACDKDDPRGQAGAGGRAAAFDAAAPQNIPEPARFAKPGPPAADVSLAAPTEGAGAVAQAASAARPAAVAPATTDDVESLASNAGRIFDASKTPPAAAVVKAAAATPAAGRASGVKHNSPAPDRVEGGALILENRQFAVDTDGLIADPARRRQVVAHDRDHRNGTALYVGGRALDSTVVPYISIPMDFKGARLGDMAKVCNGRRCAWAVIGDVGPNGRFGEGSVALAERLGLDGDGNSGGARSGVTYSLFPGLRAPTAKGQTQLADALDARDISSAPTLLADAR